MQRPMSEDISLREQVALGELGTPRLRSTSVRPFIKSRTNKLTNLEALKRTDKPKSLSRVYPTAQA